MNRYEVDAVANFIIGRIQEDAGRLVRNNRLESAGYSRQIAARARKAVGEAERLIRRCHRMKSIANDEGTHGMMGDITLVN